MRAKSSVKGACTWLLVFRSHACYDSSLLVDLPPMPSSHELALLCHSRPIVMSLPPLAPKPWCPPYLLSLKLSNTVFLCFLLSHQLQLKKKTSLHFYEYITID
ncbi:hypothetical protein AMECASPLE_022897 [Ameca splendens]|uniref:Uncharacterized protein n=1 Tax=Ameca splendens TaxID=208324 RepID=A0ABV0YFK3_9TELE